MDPFDFLLADIDGFDGVVDGAAESLNVTVLGVGAQTMIVVMLVDLRSTDYHFI